MPHDQKFETRCPSPQTALDIFEGHWACDLGELLPGAVSGPLRLFGAGDFRPRAAANVLGTDGSFAGMTVLELGPLEAAHTYQIEQLGAASVVSVEANAEAYLKCLIVKELLGMRASFLFGDFVKYLLQCAERGERYDLVFCSGVLYHMSEPLRLIELVSRVTDRCFVWTHYHLGATPSERAVGIEHGGFTAVHWLHDYGASQQTGQFWGGNMPSAAWLSREDILAAFRHFGFSQIDLIEGASDPSAAHFAFAGRRN